MLARVSGAKTTDCLKFGLVYCLLASILYDCGRTTQKRGGCDRLRRSAAKRSYPSPKVRGGDREEQPHVQGAAAAREQEGQEELLHVQDQEGRHKETPPHPR